MGIRIIQIAISAIAVVFAIVHLIRPEWAIDAIMLALFVIALLPWLGPLVESVEFPNGYKVRLRDRQVEKVARDVEKAGLLSNSPEPDKASNYSFLLKVADQDVNLALAGLRIEIERRLRTLAESRDIDAGRKGIAQLLHALEQQQILTHFESTSLYELVGLLNVAVHGAKVEKGAMEWAMDEGPRLLQGLDERIGTKSSKLP